MFRQFPVIASLLIVLLLQPLPQVETNECIDVNNPKTRVFSNLLDLQTNKISFDPREKNFQGNYVAVEDHEIDTLYKNSFITMDSKHIQKISLDDHRIREIQDGAFLTLTCLMALDLQRNQIEQLTMGIFQNLTALHELNLGENRIRELPERVFSLAPRLKRLNLSRNSLKVLHSDSFFRLSLLQELDLSYNYLRRIPPETFGHLGQLVHLQLGSNQLEQVELEKWPNLNSLAVLNLSNNVLESFDPAYDFSFSSTLTELYLEENYLTRLNPLALRKHLPSLKLIDLNENPWMCADLFPILKTLNDSHINYKGNSKSQPSFGGIACNRSLEEYQKYKWTEPPSEASSSSPAATGPPPTMSIPKSKEGLIDNQERVYTEMLEEIRYTNRIVVCFFVIVLILVIIDIVVRTGCLNGVLRRRGQRVLDNSSEVENLSLLAERF